MITLKQACVTAGIVVGTGLLTKTLLSKDEEEEVQGDWDAFWSLDESRHGAEIEVKDAPYAIEQQALDDLSRRLKNRRKLKSGAHGLKGVSLERLEAVLDHWENTYDWRLAERQLNSWNPKSAVIDGLEIRFLHIPAADQTRKARPMLLLHGWPGSVWEFHKFIPEMQNKYKDLNLEFVVPSLPGYGWSEGSAKPGLGPKSMAVMFSKLMTKGLGYKSYWVQGGDWGGIIAAFLSSITPLGEVVGTHSNFPIVDRTPWDFAHAAFFEQDKDEVAKLLPLSKVLSESMEVWQYMLFQMTRPHTLGYTLDSSPEATAAYILDKIELWSDPQSELTLDEIVTNLMFYWLPGSSTSAFELYAWLWESLGEAKRALVQPKTRPFGISMFPCEMSPPTRKAVRRTFTDLVSLSIAPRGGHFAAFEEPAILAAHVSDFIYQLEKRGTTSPAT